MCFRSMTSSTTKKSKMRKKNFWWKNRCKRNSKALKLARHIYKVTIGFFFLFPFPILLISYARFFANLFFASLHFIYNFPFNEFIVVPTNFSLRKSIENYLDWWANMCANKAQFFISHFDKNALRSERTDALDKQQQSLFPISGWEKRGKRR